MSTSSTNKISERKQNHIEACRSGNDVGSSRSAGFDQLEFIHTALPELSCDEIETGVDFLGYSLNLPFFISCMTGGSEEGKKANFELAKAAQVLKIPIGLGSIRVLFDEPEREADFALRSICPDVPILANLGAVQLKNTPKELVQEWLKKLEIDALVVHLNCGQELFQKGGDRDFRGLFDTICNAVEDYRLPLIVKETGFGIAPSYVKMLLDRGVDFIDVAGSGGTNWIAVEDSANKEFSSWGIPTAPLLDAVGEFSERILASGGLRSGMDLAKALALGSFAGGMALPLIQAALDGGEERVCRYIANIEHTLRTVMLLTGSQTVQELKKAPLIKSTEHQHVANQLKRWG